MVLVLATLACLLWSEHIKANAKFELTNAVKSVEDAARISEDQVRVTLQYASPMIFSADAPASVRRDLLALVEASAAVGLTSLDELARRVEEIRVLPWQRREATARDRVSELIEAERLRFATIAADGTTLRSVLATPPPGVEAAVSAVGGL